MSPPSTPPRGQTTQSDQRTPKTSSPSTAWSVDELSGDSIQHKSGGLLSSSPNRIRSSQSTQRRIQSRSEFKSSGNESMRYPSSSQNRAANEQSSFLSPDDGISDPTMVRRKSHRSSSTAGIFDIDTDDAFSDAGTTIAQASGPTAGSPSLFARLESINRPESSSSLPKQPIKQLIRERGGVAPNFVGSSSRHASSISMEGGAGSGSSSSSNSSTSGHTAAADGNNSLAVPLNVPHHSIGSPSPTTAKHGRTLFDTAPSFSSPLAYAPLLPTEAADDFDLESSGVQKAEGESSSFDSSSTRETVSKGTVDAIQKVTHNKEEDHTTLPTTENLRTKKSPKLDTDSSSPAVSPRLSARKSGHASSSSTTMGPPLTIPRKSSGQSSGHGSGISSSSIRLPEGGEGGPKQVRALLQRGRGGSASNNLSISGSRRVSEATSEDGSVRSASGSSTGSIGYSHGVSNVQPGTSPNLSFAALSSATPKQQTHHDQQYGMQDASQNRARSNTQTSTSSIHRRARSLGGSLLGELATSIGGPDGVDPDLVAAIRAGDAEIPGSSLLAESAKIRQLHEQNQQSSATLPPTSMTGSFSASSNLTSSAPFSSSFAGQSSVPSTPSGTLRVVSRRGELLTVGADTRALATSYPSYAVAPDAEGDQESVQASSQGKRHRTSTSSQVPPEYVRSRVRSQTTSGLTMAEHMSPRTLDLPFNETLHHEKTQGQTNYNNTGHGLGIGMGSNSNDSHLQIPDQAFSLNPNNGRSVSPMSYHDSAIISSASTSGRNSPVVWRPNADGMSESLFYPSTEDTPNKLSVQIPAFDRQHATVGPVSALPAVNYSPQASPLMIQSMLYPPSSTAEGTGSTRSDSQRDRAATMQNDDVDASSLPSSNRRDGADLFKGRSSLNHATSIRGRGKRGDTSARRLSTVQTPQGIDEYARIIIQSRNAKMQKWKTASSSQSQQRLPGYALFADDADQSSDAKAIKDATEPQSRAAATPNVSPVGSLTDHKDNLSDESGREIEWVDWLDEYRKMKEAKLRVEKEEPATDEGAQSDGKGAGLSSPVNVKGPTDSISPRQAQAPQSFSKGREEKSFATLSLSRSLASNLDYGEGKRLPKRRPSELPIRSNQFAEGTRSWSASLSPNSAFLHSSSPGTRSGDYKADERSLAVNSASLGRRSSTIMAGDKGRALSLSPITSRIGSSGSQLSSASQSGFGNTAGGKRKKLLGSKIEAWWGAVKSGFVGASNAPPASAPAHSRQSMRASIATGMGDVTRDMSRMQVKDRSGSDEAGKGASFQGGAEIQHVRSMFGESGFGSGHLRSQTHRQASEAKSVHTLRASSSAQDLKPIKKGDNVNVETIASPEPSVDQQPLRSDRSSVDTAQQVSTSKHVEVSQDRKSDTTVANVDHLTADQNRTETASNDDESGINSAQGKTRKGPKLSLHLEHGLSTFDAGPFGKMTSATQSSGGSGEIAVPQNQLASSKSSPSYREPQLSGSPKSSGLSDAWKPKSGRSLGSPQSNSNGGSAGAANSPSAIAPGPTSSNSLMSQRGRSKLRDSVAGEGRRPSETDKDITIDSIRRHIHHRLALSKENCDRELRKIIMAINAFVEEGIQEQQMKVLQQQQDEQDEIESTRRALENIEIERQGQESGKDDDALLLQDLDDVQKSEVSRKSSEQKAEEGNGSNDKTMEPLFDPDETQHVENIGDTVSSQRSRQPSTSVNAANKSEYSLPPPPQRTPSGLIRSMSRNNNRNKSRDLTSTSTSRSHSPMPGAAGGQTTNLYGAESPQYSPARRMRPLPPDDAPLDPFIVPLQDLVSIAMDVLDTTIHNLTSRTGACREIISNVQDVGRAWEEHPLWPGRGWYVQLLLAVAGLSRVVEWWEAERGFWNFAEDGDENDQKPIKFFMGSSQQATYQQLAEGAASSSAAADGASASDYNDPLPSTNTSLAKSLISSSPMRVIRSAALAQANANRTPSQQSSATNSPAIEPVDRKATFGDHIDSLRSTHSSTPILASALDDEDENGDAVKADDLKNSDLDLAANTSTAAALPSSVKESQNILMELSLDGERFLYLSPAWQTVLGSDPAELFDRPIEEVLAPGDAQTFAEATQQLQLDDSHTVEAAFRLLVHPSIIPNSDGVTRYYQEMEGKGMLMQDRQSGSSSHTMWVFKPTGPPEPEEDLAPGPQKPSTAGVGDLSVAAGTSTFDTAGQQHPFLSTEPLLCRICERDVPTWFFEKHSEICNEIHRLEMEISESNEILADLRRSARGIVTQIEASEEIIEYRSIPLSTPAASTLPPTALEVANRSLSPRHPNPAAVRKAHLRALNALIDILRIAATISTPATKDDADPIEKQRLLSPDSESKIVQVRNWKMVSLPSEDAAFDLLIADVDAAMRRKLSAVNRMLNTIVYVETVRMEWEQRVEEALAELQGTTMDAEEITADFAEEDEALVGAQNSQDDSEEQHQSSSTISHSELNRQENIASGVNSVNAPMTVHSSSAPKSTIGSVPSGSAGQEDDLDDMDGDASAVLLEQYDDAAVPGSTTLSARGEEIGREEDIPAVETSMGGSVLRPIPIPTKANIAPRIRQMQRDTSAVSSSSGGDAASNGTGAGTTGTDGGSGSNTGAASPSAPIAHHSRRESILSGERTYLQTPPLSPRHSPKEMTIPLRTVKDRRVSHSLRAMGAHSPHLSASAGGIPISPRIPPMAPSSRPTASSIKDFDIIKPISKGAFGSVFLTRKRTTGDYFAIKVLKKSDMIAKNQITNVKAERMILMTQTQSPFVVKLFFTFQSSESLFLVMEYLPGGDLANLVKALGTLSEDWTRQFVAEVVNGLETLHAQGVVHRDMKPDNLLIDQKGHLKLTDFGLSKIGLLGRQNQQQMQAPSHAAGSNTGRGSVSGAGSTPPSSWQHGKKDSISSVQSQGAPGSMAYSPLSARIPSTGRVGSIPDTPYLIGSQPFYVGTPTHPRGRIMSASTDASDSSGSEGVLTYSQALSSATASAPRQIPSATLLDSPKNPFASTVASGHGSGSAGAIGSTTGQIGSGSGAQLKKFVGTPDYLAPESILGLGMDDAAVDWWALGVILYEFLYGYPPFHASTPEKVFDNILSRNISWDDEDVEVSSEARDLMERLMCTDRKNRLGVNGAQEIKAHPFFAGIDWEHLTDNEGPFVPQVSDPESTDYFDLRGAAFMDFQNEEGNTSTTNKETNETYASSNMGIKEFAKAIEGHARFSEPNRPPTRNRTRSDKHGKDSSQGQTDEFGSFSYKNLPVLKQANDEVIKKMRGDQLNSMSAAMEQHQAGTPVGGMGLIHGRHRSISGKVVTPSSHRGSAVWMPANPPSPTTSISSQSSVPSKSTAPTSPSGAPFILGSAGANSASYHMQNLVGGSGYGGSASAGIHNPHRRRPSEMSSNAGLSGSPMGSISGSSATGPLTSMMERKRSQFANTQNEEELRRTSLPTRLRTTSTSTSGNSTGSRQAIPSIGQSGSVSHSDRPVLPWQLQVPSNVLPDVTAEGSNKASPGTAPTSSDEYPAITRGSGSGGGLGLSGANQSSNTNSPAITTAPLATTNKDAEEIHCMIAEDNPISARMLQGILTKLGCNSTTVRNGAEALRMAMGETKYSVLFVDVTLPIVSGQDVAKMIKSTRNINAITPIVALASFSGTNSLSQQNSQAFDNLLESTGGVFDAVMAKPIDKTDVCNILPRFGFMPMTQKSS